MACIRHWDRNQQRENHLKWLVHFEPNAHTLHCCQKNQDENLTLIEKLNIPIEKWAGWSIFCLSQSEYSKSDQREDLYIIDKVTLERIALLKREVMEVAMRKQNTWQQPRGPKATPNHLKFILPITWSTKSTVPYARNQLVDCQNRKKTRYYSNTKWLTININPAPAAGEQKIKIRYNVTD